MQLDPRPPKRKDAPAAGREPEARLSELMQPTAGSHATPSPPSRTYASLSSLQKPKSSRRAVFESFALATKISVVLILAWGLLFNVSEVRGLSMEPGIHDRDRILVEHVSYVLGDVARGDVAVLQYPLDPSVDYIKRIVGLPGEEIVISFGQVWIDGHLLEEPYVDQESIDPYTRLRTTVKPGHYFVMGDNRLRSSDSREFGQVPHELLRGRVRLRVWPFERMGWID